jgi:cob(I)alamin adenosyltransferase
MLEKLARIGDAHVTQLEREIDRLESELAPPTNFVLPGGTPLAASLHHARTVCRRAERRVTALAAHQPVSVDIVRWLNRVADLLFVMARVANARAGVADQVWTPRGRT